MAAPSPSYGSAPAKSSAPPKREPSPSAGPSALTPVLRLFFSFDGRIRRRDYWFTQIAVSALMYLGLWLETSVLPAAKGNMAALLPLLLFSLSLPIIGVWSALATQVKRWHDRDKSWFWLFISFVPFIGGLWMFVELGCLDGDSGDNRFGHSPKWSPAAVFT
jgi:uncharacterized membrane protein YhaH (DUF805 family)